MREFVINTPGRGFTDITGQVQGLARDLTDGLCTVFIQHTSASLIICENADPDVLRDLETWASGAVKDGDRRFHHSAEGADDMPAHIRTVLTQTSIGIPVQGGRLQLGTWQGLFLWEHRYRGHRRRVQVTLTPGV